MQARLHRIISEIKPLGDQLDAIQPPMTIQQYNELFQQKGVNYDKAKIDPIVNMKMIMICQAFVFKCHPKDIRPFIQALAEEDINLVLLVNVENALRKRFLQDDSLQTVIADALKIALKQPDKKYDTIEEINRDLSNYMEKYGKRIPEEDPFLYNKLFGVNFQLPISPEKAEAPAVSEPTRPKPR